MTHARLTPDTNLTSVIIPSHNEEAYIGPCLTAVLAQNNHPEPLEVILIANACTDRTADVALSYKRQFVDRGWKLRVLRTRQRGKVKALNCADRISAGVYLIYLDADVICGPEMMGQLRVALQGKNPVYSSGKLTISPAKTWITRRYAALWAQLPFMQSPAVGAGLFAVNRAGRARWGAFPDIISDDTFVRLHFTPDERKEVRERYLWPMVEGFSNLVRVRKRQDVGVAEVNRLYPGLMGREAKPRVSLLRLFLGNPVSFICYSTISLMVRFRKRESTWGRGR